MKSSHRPGSPARRVDARGHTPARPLPQNPLGDARYATLLAQAHAFFAHAERDMVAEKAAAIAEIRALMSEHGLGIDDLQD